MRTHKISLLIGLAVILLSTLACNLTAGTSNPTLDPQSFQGTLNQAATEAIATIHAQFTLTEDAKPVSPENPFIPVASATPENTLPATFTPTASATSSIPSLTPIPYHSPTPRPSNTSEASATPSPTPAKYACKVDSMDPAFGSTLSHGLDFDLDLRLLNTGTEKWTSDSFDLKYVSGDKFQKYGDTIDMKNDVSPDEGYTFTVDMLAFTKPGTYSATWELVRGSVAVCTFKIQYTIK
jgi:hypothetical protein